MLDLSLLIVEFTFVKQCCPVNEASKVSKFFDIKELSDF